MSFRRPKKIVLRTKGFRAFVQKNASAIQRTGLPPSIVEKERRWLYFLQHGCSHESFDPLMFTIEKMSDSEYRGLVALVTAYFESGFPFDPSIALRPDDRRALSQRFGGGGAT